MERQRTTEKNSAIPAITRNRTKKTALLFVLVLGLLTLRLASIQLFARKSSFTRYLKAETIEPRRGNIFSRSHELLAVSVDSTSIAVNPHVVNQPEELAELLSSTLDLPEEQIKTKLSKKTNSMGRPNFFVWIKRKVSDEAATRIREEAKTKRLEGLEFRTEGKREYPQSNMACQLIGFANIDGQGVEGLESFWQKTLGGQPGEMKAEVDAKGVPIPGGLKKLIPAVEGKDLVLTLDEKIQSFAEEALADCMARYRPKWAGVFVMRPHTGEVLAIAIKPDFDLNHFAKSLPEFRANRAVTFNYEPGSTFKVVTAAGVIEERAASRQQTYNCAGAAEIGGRQVHCWIQGVKGHGHGPQTLSDAIMNSCDIAMARFGACLGEEKLDYYTRQFGFCRPTHVGCPHERRGWLDPVDQWSEVRLANLAFGQGILVTPIQLLCAMSAIANNGQLMKPYVLKEICSKDGQVLKHFNPTPIRQVVSPETTHAVLDMMKRVVDEGTGKPASVEGYPIAGKTGSAEKAFGPHGYVAGRYVSSFCGLVPTTHPELAILVIADEPRGCHWGSTICGPVFREVAMKSLWRLGVRPTRPLEKPVKASAVQHASHRSQKASDSALHASHARRSKEERA